MTEEQVSSLTKIGKEEYLGRLSEVDRNNLQLIGKLFKDALTEKKRKGALVVVGGTLSKPLPRKDIDVLVVLERDQDEQIANLSPYRRALVDFEFLLSVIETIVKKDLSLQIDKVIEPAIDEEFESESILKHDGSITIRPDTGVPVELIRSNRQRVSEVTAEMKSPYVIIAEVT